MNRRLHNDQLYSLLWVGLHLLLLTVLLVMAYLKETPSFWLNAGGWPIWFRDMVASSFYALYALEFLLLSIFSLLVAANVRLGRRDDRLALLCLPILWLLCLMIGALVVANNLDNVMAGRPLHWHPH